jgi:uncharacterized cupin superfamily protein
MEIVNVWGDDWQRVETGPGWEHRARRLVPAGRPLGMGLYELPPGQTQCAYHFHHGNEEALLVLRGTPTLRTPDGERQLAPGDAVHFPTGPAGAHQVVNRSAEPVRYVIAASHVSPEVVEYPDSGKIGALSRGESMAGGPLFSIHRVADAVDYLEGESPRG